MQTLSANLLAAAHARLNKPITRLTLDDPRIRGWVRNQNLSTNTYPFDAILAGDGSTLLRAYNDCSGDPGVLHIATAAAGAAPNFADVAGVATNLRRWSGVALFADASDGLTPERADCYFFDNTAGTPNLQYRTSADYGDTWGAATTLGAMKDAQLAAHPPQIAVAGWNGNNSEWGAEQGAGRTYMPFLFYTTASSTDTTLEVNLVFYDGVANTHTRCTLLNLDLPALLDWTDSTSGISALRAGARDFVCAVALNRPRGVYENGIYLIWYRDGLWSNPQPVFTYQPDDPEANNSTYSLAYPRLWRKNNTWCLTAVEYISIPGLSTDSAIQSVSHLVLFKSPDGLHWSGTRQIIAGTDSLDNGYWTYTRQDPSDAYDVQFTSPDLLNARVLVAATRTFLVTYGRLFQLNNGTPSSLTGTASDYAASTLDITDETTGWEVSLPGDGAAGQATVRLVNPSLSTVGAEYVDTDDIGYTPVNELRYAGAEGLYTGHRLMRPGNRIVLEAGYRTASNDDTDYTTLFTGRIDEVRQQTKLGGNEFELVCKDWASALLDDWTATVPVEYSSTRRIFIRKFADYGSTIQIQGAWVLDEASGFLVAQPTPTDPITGDALLTPNLALMVTNTGRVEDGIFDVKFKYQNVLASGRLVIPFRYQNNWNFQCLAFNYLEANKWDLLNVSGSDATNVVVESLLGAAVNPALTVPAADEVWWVRLHLYHDRIVASARRNDRTTWTKILDNTNLRANQHVLPRSGYWGVGARSSQARYRTKANGGGDYTWADAVDLHDCPYARATAFTAPNVNGSCNLVSYGAMIRKHNDPGGSISFYILQDNGSNEPVAFAAQDASLAPANVTIGAGEIAPDTYTTVTPSSAVDLTPGNQYWVVYKLVPDVNESMDWVGNHFEVASTVKTGGLRAYMDMNNCDGGGTGWFVSSGREYVYVVKVSGPGAQLAVGGYTLYTQELPVSIDNLCREIAAKAGVTTTRQDYYADDDFTGLITDQWDYTNRKGSWQIVTETLKAFNSNGAYGALRYDGAAIGEFIAEFDMVLGGGANDPRGGFFLAQQNTSSLSTAFTTWKMYIVEFNVTSNKVSLYATDGAAPSGTNQVYDAVPLIDLAAATQYHVKVQHAGKFLMVWLNDVLVAGFRQYAVSDIPQNQLKPDGYVGLLSYSNGGAADVNNPAVTYDNFQITEIKETQDYFVIEEGQTGAQAFQNLLKFERIKSFGDYDGAWRYGYFDGVADTAEIYSTTIKSASRRLTDRYWISHARPFGDYQAERFSPVAIDQYGTRYRSFDYTDSQTDRGAYHAAAYPLRRGLELGETYEFTALANPGLQREDQITVTNPLDGVSGSYLVDAVTFTYQGGEEPLFDMQVTCRKFIAANAEDAV